VDLQPAPYALLVWLLAMESLPRRPFLGLPVPPPLFRCVRSPFFTFTGKNRPPRRPLPLEGAGLLRAPPSVLSLNWLFPLGLFFQKRENSSSSRAAVFPLDGREAASLLTQRGSFPITHSRNTNVLFSFFSFLFSCPRRTFFSPLPYNFYIQNTTLLRTEGHRPLPSHGFFPPCSELGYPPFPSLPLGTLCHRWRDQGQFLFARCGTVLRLSPLCSLLPPFFSPLPSRKRPQNDSLWPTDMTRARFYCRFFSSKEFCSPAPGRDCPHIQRRALLFKGDKLLGRLSWS